MLRWTLPALSLTASLTVGAQKLPIVALHGYGPERGLSNRHVTSLLQDDVGYIWVGTVSGLDRFDGHSFRNWSMSDGLTSGRVDVLRRDGDGLLWVVCTAVSTDIMSIDILDPGSGVMRTMRQRFPALPFEVEELVRIAPQLPDGEVVFGAARPARCVRYRKDGRFVVHPLEGERFEPLGDDRTSGVIGHLVLTGGGQRIVRVDTSGTVSVLNELEPGTHVEPMVSGRTGHGALYKVTAPGAEPVYFDTYSELLLDRATVASPTLLDRSGDPIHRPVNFTPVPRMEGRLEDTKLIDASGRIIFDLSEHHPEVGGRVKDCLIDRSGDPWLATEFGLFHVELRKDVFQRILYEDHVPSGMGVLCRGMQVDGDRLLLATEWQGAYIVGLGKDSVSVEQHLKPQYLFASYLGKDGTWWRGGPQVVVAGEPGRSERRFVVKDRIWSILADVQDGLLLGGLEGFTWLDARTGMTRSWNDLNFPELAQAHVLQLQAVSDGRVLAATSKGMYLLGRDGRVEDRAWTGATGKMRLPYDDLHHCYIDREGVWWLSTRGAGLVSLDPRTGQSQQYTMRNGFPNNMVYAAYEDGYDQLWLPTDGGLVRFDKHTRQCAVFTTNDGITHDEFNRLAHARGPDSTLYFGGLNGITAFHPDRFKPSKEQVHTPLVLTRFQGYSVQHGGMVDRLTEVQETGGLRLGENDRSIQLSFALLSYEGTGRILYAWRLAGVEDEWNYQHDPSVRLDRLPYGDHVLEVKARDGMGHWSQRTLEVPIHVEGPWHASRWAMMGMGALFVLTLYGAIRALRRLLSGRVRFAKAG